MINQKPISLKIEKSIYFELEKEITATGTPRNRLINAAIEHYLQYLDKRRAVRMWAGNQEALEIADDYMTKIFGKF